MKKSIPIIVNFISSLKVCNHKGFKLHMKNRENSVFIIVLRGRIHFTQNGKSVIATPDTPIYIPRGATYLNECLEDAESLLFNFEEISAHPTIALLAYVDPQKAIQAFDRISILQSRKSSRAEAEVFSLFYSIVRECYTENITAERTLITPALEYIELHFNDTQLTVAKLADLCCISTVYLNKLFKQEIGETPFLYITRRRMETARDMMREHCSVGETARFVGYSDIYQFSRAFKKYYGVSPKTVMV